MSKKLYYTDPLASAYMAREFGVKFINYDNGDREYGFDDIIDSPIGLYDNVDAMVVYPHPRDHYKLYIHPDSYHIFESMAGDVFRTTRADAISVEFIMSDIRAIEFKNFIKTQGAKIIQRDNKPFFWPEEEV